MNKTILLITLLLSTTAYADMSGMNMSKMTMDKGTQAKVVTHQGKGTVVKVDAGKSSVKLSHEAIPSLGWSAMTMNFKVANTDLLKDIKVGDGVAFELSADSTPVVIGIKVLAVTQ